MTYTEDQMKPEQRIDAALDSILNASGSALKHYTMPKTLNDMREAMRKIMSDSYIAGSNAAFNAVATPSTKLFNAVENFIKQKGRHNTELAYYQLEKAYKADSNREVK